MSRGKTWIVTLSGDRSTSEIKKDLVKAGFTVEQVLAEIGSIIGSASDDVAKQVGKISGVADISPDTSIDIGPPDAPTTW
jgi:hypothetical protein